MGYDCRQLERENEELRRQIRQLRQQGGGGYDEDDFGDEDHFGED
jgi:hypothetical protein